jgi:WD40 repeat protein
VRKLAGHSALVDGVGFSSDGKQLVSGAADGEVWTWDLSTGKGTRLGKRDGRLYSAFFVDGEHVVTAGSAGALESWALSNGNRAAVGTYATEVNRAEPSVDRRWAVVGTDDETVGLWDVVDRAPRWRTAGLLAGPARALTQRGWTTTSGSATTETRFAVGDSLLAQQGDTRCELQAGHHLVAKTSSETWLDVPAVDADALWVTSGACVARRGARVVSWLQGRGERVLAEDAAAVGTDGEAVLVATSSRLLRLHPDGAVLDTAGGAPLVSAVARRAGRWMVGQLDGSVELMGERTLDRVHGRQVTVLAADDGDLVAAGYVDGTVALWHAPSGLLLARDRVHGSVSHLLFDGGALHAATVTGDLTVLPTQVFTRPHCEVISEVAAHVTRGWEDGHLVDLPAPPPCFAL